MTKQHQESNGPDVTRNWAEAYCIKGPIIKPRPFVGREVSMFFCDDDDDTAVIALWIISIGFVILAIDKTTRLSQKPACDNEKLIQPLIQLNKQVNGKNKNGNDDDEDMQFKRIEQQISQLRDSIQDIKKNLQESPSKNGGKKDDRKKSGE
ncbi:hypothetical protein P4V43_27205 [Brevibacillus fortis]|nr:hypothetical protein [Brevibacillus fortis]MED1785515.1 hypothetical protein [Brevibacillus fortis]